MDTVLPNRAPRPHPHLEPGPSTPRAARVRAVLQPAQAPPPPCRRRTATSPARTHHPIRPAHPPRRPPTRPPRRHPARVPTRGVTSTDVVLGTCTALLHSGAAEWRRTRRREARSQQSSGLQDEQLSLLRGPADPHLGV